MHLWTYFYIARFITSQTLTFAFELIRLVCGRKINEIKIVGRSYIHNRDDIEDCAYDQLKDLQEDERRLSLYKNINSEMRFPRRAEIDEPFMIMFEDGDRIEIDAPQDQLFRMSMNCIPWNIESGIHGETCKKLRRHTFSNNSTVLVVYVNVERYRYMLSDGVAYKIRNYSGDEGAEPEFSLLTDIKSKPALMYYPRKEMMDLIPHLCMLLTAKIAMFTTASSLIKILPYRVVLTKWVWLAVILFIKFCTIFIKSTAI